MACIQYSVLVLKMQLYLKSLLFASVIGPSPVTDLNMISRPICILRADYQEVGVDLRPYLLFDFDTRSR